MRLEHHWSQDQLSEMSGLSIRTIQRIENETVNLPESDALSLRQKLIKKVEENGIIATPANSYINELVNEAARISILDDGVQVKILYGEHPHVEHESR